MKLLTKNNRASHIEHDAILQGPLAIPLGVVRLGNGLVIRDTKNRSSFLGECGVSAKWEPNDFLSLNLGYQLTWLQGVALAPEQVVVTNPC